MVRPRDFLNTVGTAPRNETFDLWQINRLKSQRLPSFSAISAVGAKSSASRVVAQHHKGPKQTGGFSSLVPDHRMPTPYTRGIAKFSTLSTPLFWYGSSSSTREWNMASSGDLGFSEAAGLGFTVQDYNWTSGAFSVSNNVFEALTEEASTKAMANLLDAQLELGESLGEMGETISMLHDLIMSVWSALRALRARDYQYFVEKSWKTTYRAGKAGRTSSSARIRIRRVEASWRRHAVSGWKRKGDIAANGWLTYQYGISPLIKDIYAGMAILEKGLHKGRVIRGVAIASRRFTPIGYVRPSAFTGFGRDSVKSVYYGLVSSDIKAALGALGVLNPYEVVWALVPFSFVFDWFVPVGTFLRAITAYMNVQWISGTDTLMREVRNDCTNVSPILGSPAEPGNRLPYGTLEFFAMNRRVRASKPIPLPFLGKGVNSLQRLASATALITQWR